MSAGALPYWVTSKPRPVCCGKKRSWNQIEYIEGYDGGAWKCKPGEGCKKDRKQ